MNLHGLHVLGMDEVLLRFAVALVLSSLVGLERERKGRAAGLRTHVLVCFGATLMMVVGEIMAAEFASTADTTVRIDMARIAAGIITGVGFLGAGTIIHDGAAQRGLTTAAMIWFVAALGVTVGAGYLIIGFVATVLVITTVLVLEILEGFLSPVNFYELELRTTDGLSAAKGIERAIRDEGFRVVKSGLKISSEKQLVSLSYEITTRKKGHIEALAQRLQRDFPSLSRLDIER